VRESGGGEPSVPQTGERIAGRRIATSSSAQGCVRAQLEQCSTGPTAGLTRSSEECLELLRRWWRDPDEASQELALSMFSLVGLPIAGLERNHVDDSVE
jgi:hypothetical protein